MSMNNREALIVMFEGKTVKAIEPLYLRHKPPPLFRWNESGGYVEWQQCSVGEWKPSFRSFFALSSEFEIAD